MVEPITEQLIQEHRIKTRKRLKRNHYIKISVCAFLFIALFSIFNYSMVNTFKWYSLFVYPFIYISIIAVNKFTK